MLIEIKIHIHVARGNLTDTAKSTPTSTSAVILRHIPLATLLYRVPYPQIPFLLVYLLRNTFKRHLMQPGTSTLFSSTLYTLQST